MDDFARRFSKIRWFPLALNRSSKAIFERTENNVLCVALAADGRTMAVSTRDGEVHLLSTLMTSQLSSLRYICRMKINSQCGSKRKQTLHLPLSQHLINYLLYKDIKMK